MYSYRAPSLIRAVESVELINVRLDKKTTRSIQTLTFKILAKITKDPVVASVRVDESSQQWI